MSSVADFQARARARATQPTHIIPEVTMDDAPGPSENGGSGGADNESTGNDPDPVRRVDVRHEGLTIDEVARLVRRHKLHPGRVKGFLRDS